MNPVLRAVVRLLGLLLLVGLGHVAAAESLTVNGQKRTYNTVNLRPGQAAPLVVVLHGNRQQGEDVEARSRWPELAAREGFGLVFPDGLNKAWADLRDDAERAGQGPPQGTDDRGFLLALVDFLIQRGVADPRRIYLAGVSNGGAMALSLACTNPERFAGVASAIMSMTQGMVERCPAWGRPVPVLFMNGTADPLVPYGGGRGTARIAVSGVIPTPMAVEYWRTRNGCRLGDARLSHQPDRDGADGSTVSLIESNCPPGAEVSLFRINGGGHRVPGFDRDARFSRLVDTVLGPQNHDVDGPEEIWRFFARQPTR